MASVKLLNEITYGNIDHIKAQLLANDILFYNAMLDNAMLEGKGNREQRQRGPL